MQGFSAKQIEFLENANHRWNIKSGATRSGKTYLDYFVIPKRIRRVAGKDGLVVLLGNTKGTLQRNIIEPLQNIWGMQLVSDIKSDNTAFLFGEKVFCLGADKVNQVDKIRGSGIKYCYGDEVVTWHEDVFTMLKSRLDKAYSCFDGTCNPGNPNHWFKRFLDSDADIYRQDYTIYDNPFLSSAFIANLEKEYSGTVFWDRYILGRWVPAEGVIYRRFADNPDAYIIPKTALPKLRHINIGVDFGGNQSNHAFVAIGISEDWTLYVLRTKSIKANGTDVFDLISAFNDFAQGIERDYGSIDDVYCDSAEQTIINTMRRSRRSTKYSIRNAIKKEIIDRIRATCLLMSRGRIWLIDGECEPLINGLKDAVWDSKKLDDVRLDDGTSDIDVLDAFEYAWEREIRRLLG